MKKIGLALCFIICVGLVPLFCACSSKSKLVSVYSVDFYDSSISIAVGETTDLQYKVFPANATNKSVEFSSLDPSSAVVDKNGKVTLLKNQKTDIIIRTIDGGYTAKCTILPLVAPEEISLNTSMTEQKYIGGTSKNVLVLSVGQTKSLPVVVLPENSSKEKLAITCNNSNVEISREADWLIYGAKIGQSEVVVKYGDVSCTFSVFVEDKAASAELKLHNSSQNIISKENGIYVGESYLSLNNDKYLFSLNFKSKNLINSNQIKIQTLVSDESVFVAEPLDGFQQYCDNFEYTEESGSDKLEPFNFLKYIKIVPKADGVAKLYILTDCLDERGLPIRIEVELVISASVGEVEAKLASGHYCNESDDADQVVYVDEIFSFDVKKFANLHGEKYEILTKRKTYYRILSGAAYVQTVEETQDGNYFGNYFSCKAVSGKDKVSIGIYVEKEQNSGTYESIIVEFYVADRIASVYAEYDGEFLVQNSEVAIVSSINSNISYNDAVFKFGVVKEDGSCVNISDLCWDFEVISSNEYILNVDLANKQFVVNGSGRVEILIKINDGEQEFTKTITVHVLIDN